MIVDENIMVELVKIVKSICFDDIGRCLVYDQPEFVKDIEFNAYFGTRARFILLY